MQPDDAINNLSFANNMHSHLMQYKHSLSPDALRVEPTGQLAKDKGATQAQKSSRLIDTMVGENPQDFNPQAEPTVQQGKGLTGGVISKDTAGQPELPDITSKIKDLETNHQKEIMMLKHEMEVQGLKQTNEQKINDLETKHKKNIDDLKNTVKGIINGQS